MGDFAWNTREGSPPLEFSSRLFPPMKGHGLFARLSAVNHSCEPNAEVLYVGSSTLILVARRQIAAGEEICISYIDHEEEDADERQRDLQSYGFRCDCRRCRPRKRKAKPKVRGPRTK